MSSLDTRMLIVIDEFHYVMYRLGRKENGLQIFYRCLRETQDKYPDRRRAAVMIGSEGKNIKGRGMQSLVSLINPQRACAARVYCSCPVCVCFRGPHLRLTQLSDKLDILTGSV